MWVVQAQFAGYVLAQRELAGLELVPWRPGTSALGELLAGRAELAVASPGQVLARGRAVAEQLAFVALFMAESPIVLAGLRGGRGERLAAAGGARVGVWEGEDLEIRAMLLSSGVGLDEVEFVPMADDVRPLLTGEVDLLQATTYEEVPRLLREGASLDALILHSPRSHGVDVAKDGLIVRRDLLEREPRLVDAVVAAALHGWRRALSDPESAVAAVCAAATDLDSDWQRGQLERIAALIGTERPLGYPDAAECERAARVHRLLGNDVAGDLLLVDPRPWERAAA